MYIVKEGELHIEKYTTTERVDTKLLATIEQGEIIGEASLNNTDPKQVRVSANTDTTLLTIDAQNNFEAFTLQYPKEALSLLTYIIELSNKRLLKSNALITASYEINKTISELSTINYKSTFEILHTFQKILGNSYILYIEVNPVVPNMAMIKYDTRKENILQDIVLSLDESTDILKLVQESGREVVSYNEVFPLNLGDIKLGYLIIGKEHGDFNDTEKKMIHSITNSLVGLLRQINTLKEEQDKNSLRD
ncbi:MAG: cyclic nucleotide-binding domain-containing protein [Candidatus Peribacteria bacterium]|nr:MAG: cyclic nucleotide-binding domain-containing protein [Candidatus Peribacteria bacterium]